MPLKHHTETAYLFFLAGVICVYGVLLSLLPHFPSGVLYWCILMGISLVYPLVLTHTFRANRADYEFRFLHWTPAFMTVLWLALEFLAGWHTVFFLLQLGVLFLWSLPLVVLFLTLIVLFCLHVIRRQGVRIPVIVGLFVAFFALSLGAESLGWNANLQHFVFADTHYSRLASAQYKRLVLAIMSGSSSTSSGAIIAVAGSSSSASATLTSSSMSSSKDTVAVVIPTTIKPVHLPQSGPGEVYALIMVTLLGLYCRTLHSRAVRRMQEL